MRSLTPSTEQALRKELNPFDAVAIVVGTIIGSGIFLIPSAIAQQLPSLGLVLLVWILGGVLTVFGALSLAELGSLYPGAGGICTYLRQAYGSLPAFLYTWGLFCMIHTGSIAALGVAFGLYIGQLVSLNAMEEKIVSVLCIAVMTTINCLGIRSGKFAQNLIATAKVTGLAGIIVLSIIGGSRPLRLMTGAAGTGHAFPLVGFGIALVAVLFAYEGWHVVSFAAGEMKNPKVDLPRSLLFGSLIVLLIYLTANLSYYHVLSPQQIRDSNAVAALMTGTVLGSVAAAVISILILVSILGSMNGLVLTGARAYFGMAREGVFLSPFAQLSERYRTPVFALIVQGVWAAVLAASGSYQQIFTDVIVTAWIFYGLAAAGVIVLRHTQPQLERPFRVPGYPVVPLLFCAAALGVVLSIVVTRPFGAMIGIGLVATGIPIYALMRRKRPEPTLSS